MACYILFLSYPRNSFIKPVSYSHTDGLMPQFAIVDAPSILGLRPTGVEHLPEALRAAGLLTELSGEYAGRISSLPYNPNRD